MSGPALGQTATRGGPLQRALLNGLSPFSDAPSKAAARTARRAVVAGLSRFRLVLTRRRSLLVLGVSPVTLLVMIAIVWIASLVRDAAVQGHDGRERMLRAWTAR